MKVRRGSLRAAVAALLLAAVPGVWGQPARPAADAAAATRPPLVIIDQDASGLVGGNSDVITMFLHAPGVRVAGITTVTGDGWVRQGTQSVLKLLEIQGRSDVPVHQGAEFPLVQPPTQLVRDTRIYGGLRTDPWLGAYSSHSPPSDRVVPPDGGFAVSKRAEATTAAEFIVKTVRAHPGEVVIYNGGPLTNLALAINLAPDIIPLVREVVFMGTSPLVQPRTVNVIFDPEAAARVLHAPWPKLTIFTVDVAEKVHRDIAIARQIAAGGNTPIAALYRRRFVEPFDRGEAIKWFRMPDELMASYVIDPTIVTAFGRYYVDINLAPGMMRGASVYWDVEPKAYGGMPWPEGKETPGIEKAVPSQDAPIMTVAEDFDKARFLALFRKLMTTP